METHKPAYVAIGSMSLYRSPELLGPLIQRFIFSFVKSIWEQMTPGVWPIWIPGVWLQGFTWGTTEHCCMLNI